ncbi:SDR family NAD(P)-dependent oxidoreductase [soil metagenome]
MKEFQGKVAVITGAASGIGRGLAERCAREGMKLVLAGINEGNLLKLEAELVAAGATVMSVRTDVSKLEDIEALAQKTVERFGAVHLLVNNAGIGAGLSPWESTWKDWEWVLGVNLWGVIYGVKVFTPIMLAQTEPCQIVNVSSIAGLVAFHPSAPYQVAKHAVVALSENLQISLAQQEAQVKVSVVCPGWVRTGIMTSMRNRPAELQNPQFTPTAEQIARWTEAKEKMEAGMSPEEVAEHVFQAMAEDRFYVLTHPEHTPGIAERMTNIVEGKPPRSPF